MIKIAVIDDHNIFLEGLVNILQKNEQIEIIFYSTDPYVFLNNLEKTAPDLIITDISMPLINGFELIKKIKKITNNVKILVMSSHKYFSDKRAINGFLPKDCSKETLIKAIESIVIQKMNYFDDSIDFNEDFSHFKKSILSQREIEIIKYIAEEKTSDEISEILFLSKNTIDTHRKNIFIKLNVSNLAGLVKKATYLGYIN